MGKVLTHPAPHQRTRGGRGGIDCTVISRVTSANTGSTLSHTTHACCYFGKLRLIYCVCMRHCTGTDLTRTLVPVGTSWNNCSKSKWLIIVELNCVISMEFRNGKMPRSHVDMAYAAIRTVKVAHLPLQQDKG